MGVKERIFKAIVTVAVFVLFFKSPWGWPFAKALFQGCLSWIAMGVGVAVLTWFWLISLKGETK